MAERRLSAEEQALWARVTATVRALEGRPAGDPDQVRSSRAQSRDVPHALPSIPSVSQRVSTSLDTNGARPNTAADTLDGGWDRRLRRGLVGPERSIDLHGHTLASAHALIDLPEWRMMIKSVPGR